MKISRYAIILHLLCISNFIGYVKAQSITYTPGPANIETSKFAHIYFFRDGEDEFPENWLGVIINDDLGMCVKAKMKHIYRVNTVLSGKIRLHSKNQEETEEISLTLSPGDNYYIELNIEKTKDGKIAPKYRMLDKAEGLSRIKSSPNKIQERYCILPFAGDNDFRENAYEDKMRWYAAKNYHYYFSPLPSWEIILRSKLKTVLGFSNKLISNTYSEVGGILYQPITKIKSEMDFEIFCKEKFIKSTLDHKRDSMIRSEVKSVEIHEGIKYAKIVNIEAKSISNDLSNENSLLIHSTYVLFFWTDEKGKGNNACLYTSERGLPNELHDISTLEERILWSWNSFRLVKN